MSWMGRLPRLPSRLPAGPVASGPAWTSPAQAGPRLPGSERPGSRRAGPGQAGPGPAGSDRSRASSGGPDPGGRHRTPPKSRLRSKGLPSALLRSLVAGAPALGRVRRVARVEPRSVALVSVVFYLSLLVVYLVAGIVVWVVASLVGAVHHLEHLAVSLGFSPLGNLGLRLLSYSLYAGLALVLLGTVTNVILAVVYNLVSGVVGGVGVVIADEDSTAGPTG